MRCTAALARISILVIGLIFSWQSECEASGPSPDPITGKYYERVATPITWDEARVASATRFFGGVAGHLATIEDMDENSVLRFFPTAESWIGLTDSTATSTLDGFDLSTLGTFEAGNTSGLPLPPPGTMPVSGQRGAGFRWLTGEPYTFLNWRTGAPGDFLGQADGVYLIVQGAWQDASAGATVGQPGIGGSVQRVYNVEYDTALNQHQFHVIERTAAASFNSGGHVTSVALAENLLGLSQVHADVAGNWADDAFVISFHDPDLGGGLDDYVRRPYLQNEFGVNEETDFAYRATAKVTIPTAGDWTFAFMSGDRVRLRIGGNEFEGNGTIQNGPPRLTQATEGSLTAAPGGSGDTFFFPSAGVYDLNLTAIERDSFGFIQLFGAPGNLTAFDSMTFDLLGDQLNGGLVLAEDRDADFDNDGNLDCRDINELVDQVAHAAFDVHYDLNGDGMLTSADVTAWRAEAGAANLPSGGSYLPGDANLDGNVDGSDFIIWNGNKFSAAAAWCLGDFNADGFVDGSDFVIWNANKFTSADSSTNPVPEPGPWWILTLAQVICLGRFDPRK